MAGAGTPEEAGRARCRFLFLFIAVQTLVRLGLLVAPGTEAAWNASAATVARDEPCWPQPRAAPPDRLAKILVDLADLTS